MAFALGELADLLHEGKRFPEIAKSKRALNAVGFIAQLPIRSLTLETQGFITRQRRDAAATRRAGFLREGLGHVTVCNLSIKGNGGRSAIDLPEHGAAIFRAGAWVIFSIVCEPGLACGVTAVMTCILSGF